MAQSDYIFEVTTATFEQDVLKAAQEHPVLIDFWASWCGPCQTLGPILEKLTEEYAGAFTLAKINADDEQMLAAQFGVRSLPTVALLYKEQILDHFIGAKPEGEIRALLEKHVGPPPQDADDDNADHSLFSELPLEQSIELLRGELRANPDQPKLRAELSAALVRSGQLDEARQLYDSLDDDTRADDSGKRAAALIELATSRTTDADLEQLHQRIEADPGDLQARYALAVHHLLHGANEPSLEQLLEIMRRDRSFADDIGRRGLVNAFIVIEDSALVARYRSKMTSLLF